MSKQSKSSVSRLVVMGALLLLAATASSCGSLPTAPDVDQTAVNERSAGAANVDWIEIGELPDGGDEPAATFVPDPEIQVPSLEPRPGNSDWGHSRKRHNK